MFKLEYENTLEDFVHGEEIRHSLNFKRTFWDITFSTRILPIFLLVYGLSCIYIGINIPGILMLILSIALPLVGKFQAPKSRKRLYRNRYKELIDECPHLLEKKTFTLDDTSIKILFNNGTIIVHSLDILKKSVLDGNSIYLFIYKDCCLLTIIPYSAFNSEDDLSKFSEHIKRP